MCSGLGYWMVDHLIDGGLILVAAAATHRRIRDSRIFKVKKKIAVKLTAELAFDRAK